MTDKQMQKLSSLSYDRLKQFRLGRKGKYPARPILNQKDWYKEINESNKIEIHYKDSAIEKIKEYLTNKRWKR